MLGYEHMKKTFTSHVIIPFKVIQDTNWYDIRIRTE